MKLDLSEFSGVNDMKAIAVCFVSRGLTLTISLFVAPFVAVAQSFLDRKDIDGVTRGIVVLPELDVKVFQVGDANRPRLGRVLASEQSISDGHNFEYCDGTRGFVDIESLKETDRRCGNSTLGPFRLPDGAIAVYDSEFNLIGELVELKDVDSGVGVGVAEIIFSNGLETSFNAALGEPISTWNEISLSQRYTPAQVESLLKQSGGLSPIDTYDLSKFRTIYAVEPNSMDANVSGIVLKNNENSQ